MNLFSPQTPSNRHPASGSLNSQVRNSAGSSQAAPPPQLRHLTLSLVVGLSVVAASNGADTPAASSEWVAPARAARKANPIPADAVSIGQGKELFMQACLPCHGPQGKGDGPAAATLERDGKPIRPGNLSNPKLWDQTDGTLFWKISEGRSPMPAFQESYPEEQRWRIVNYVRTLASKP